MMTRKYALSDGRNLDLVRNVTLDYATLPESQYLVVPRVAGAKFEEKPLSIAFKAATFKVAHLDNAELAGFRSILKGGLLINDELMNLGANRDAFIAKLKRGLTEDLSLLSIERDVLEIDTDVPFTQINEPVISLGSDEPTNYGSWLYRILPKLIDIEERRDLPILLPISYAPWMKNMLDTMFDTEKLEVIHQRPKHLYKLKSVLIPSLRNSGIYFDDGTLSFFRQRAARVPGKSPYEKIYLSRQAAARKRPDLRPVINELEFIDRLEARGFKSIEIETFPLETQMQVIRDAKTIVVPGGSGLFGCVFAQNAEFVLDCEPGRTWIHGHHSLLKSCRLNHTVCYGTRSDEKNAHSSWSIDIEGALSALP